ncbi:hypothetical protein MNV49_002575 [Pseudohyphozyma bogoriensis]|nr:hypothetical protein MNV49_002575 [Pseudohyphozyma bogoriensis]
MKPRLVSTLVPFLLTAFSLPAMASAQIIGTTTTNISSDSTNFQYVSTWRSDVENGMYQAYSNASDASVTFTFVGVQAQYIAVKKYDRGLFLMRLDGTETYTVDLYDDSGYTQPPRVAWTSPVVPYGEHNVTLLQVGIDARFGFYPYLITSTWINTVPTNVAAYTSTEVLTTATTGAASSATGNPTHTNKAVSVAPIIGGVIGGVVALCLAGFLLFLWRKDKASRKRGGGAVLKVKRGEGKMTIEDDYDGGDGTTVPPPGGPGYGGYGSYYHSSSSPPRSSSHGSDPYATPHHSYSSHSPHNPAYASLPLHTEGGAYANSGYGGGNTGGGAHMSSPGTNSGSYHSGEAWGGPGSGTYTGSDGSRRDSKSYPYHTQAEGGERRSYPVPEI